MKYNITTLAKRLKPRRPRTVIVRDIVPPAILATDLYRSAYLPILAPWEQALPAIMAEYERSLSAMTQDSAEDITRRIDQADGEMQRLFLLIRPLASRMILKIEAWHRGKWRGALLSATGVDVGTLIGPGDVQETLGALIERNVALVKDVGTQTRGRISDAVFRGLNERRAAADVAREIREAVDMGRARAKRIASDQLSKVSSALADERRREAGIDLWSWLHSGKMHPRAEHVARNGNIYSDALSEVGTSADGKTVQPPPNDRPGQLPFCGCRGRAVIVF